MALTQKGELWVLEQVIQHSDYNFIKVKLLQGNSSCRSVRHEVPLFADFYTHSSTHSIKEFILIPIADVEY